MTFTARSWRLRIDVDSAPTRIAAKQTVVGTVDFTTHRHMVDFWPAINQGDAAILFCFVFLYLACAGGGSWSVDRALRKAE